MKDLTDRGKRFRAVIAAFIEERRAAKEKDKNYDQDKFEYRTWLAGAVGRVSWISVATHVLKATNPNARGSNPYVPPASLPRRDEVGTHSVQGAFAEDVTGNAAALDVFKFLKIEVDGRRLLDWMQEGDADLSAALSEDAAEAAGWMGAFASLARRDGESRSHPLAKQVYWLVGENPRNDADFHLLQPLFSSTLQHAVHANIQDARFGQANVEARKAFREQKPWRAPYSDYQGLAYRKLGGTKPQTVSQLNSERGGVCYQLPSLPQPAWKPAGMRLLKLESVFGTMLSFGTMRERVRSLADFLASDPERTVEMRTRRETIEREIADELAVFGTALRAQYASGWTRHEECRLPRHQQLWLDPERTTLPVRADPEHPEWQVDDEAFNREYERGDWADQVAGEFGLWLNQQLRSRSERLAALGDAEMRHFARQAVLDVAWPQPMQRRAAGGSA